MNPSRFPTNKIFTSDARNSPPHRGVPHLLQILLCLTALAGSTSNTFADDLSRFTISSLGETAEVDSNRLEVLFNPKEYTITKSTPWKHHDIQGLDAPTLEFTSGEPYRCQFELFFDRYEEGKSVREITDKVERLAVGSPPLLVEWGNASWTSRLLDAHTTITAFSPDGTPVAAAVRTTWSTFRPPGYVAYNPQAERIAASLTSDGIRLPAMVIAGSVELLRHIEGRQVDVATGITADAARGLTPPVRLKSGGTERVQMELEFDVSKGGTSLESVSKQLGFLTGAQSRPPVVLLTWGTGLAFKGMLESFSPRFTLFLDDGTPVRAVMNIVWKEFSPAEDQLKGNPRH